MDPLKVELRADNLTQTILPVKTNGEKKEKPN
jgi:hypothetical protein